VTTLADIAVGLGVLMAPTAVLTLWMLLLNRRDRRRDAVEATVGDCCAELGFRGAFAVDVRVAVCGRRMSVALDMRLCRTDEIWFVIERLRQRLPQRATLRVVTSRAMDRQSRAALAAAVVVVL
jgi:hypothetical protein